jgi:hypothetical protein
MMFFCWSRLNWFMIFQYIIESLFLQRVWMQRFFFYINLLCIFFVPFLLILGNFRVSCWDFVLGLDEIEILFLKLFRFICHFLPPWIFYLKELLIIQPERLLISTWTSQARSIETTQTLSTQAQQRPTISLKR